MSYAILCNARSGRDLGIKVLALVDRRKSRKHWWTSDSIDLMLTFPTETAANKVLRNFKHNNARVVSYRNAAMAITGQRESIDATENNPHVNMDRGWDTHKMDTF